jgi:hypothetical protein
MAHIVGERALPFPPQTLAVPFPTVASATPERFTLRVLLPDMSPLPYNPPNLRNATTVASMVRNTLKWTVSWIGVEA